VFSAAHEYARGFCHIVADLDFLPINYGKPELLLVCLSDCFSGFSIFLLLFFALVKLDLFLELKGPCYFIEVDFFWGQILLGA
jgi:hypothetical protein